MSTTSWVIWIIVIIIVIAVIWYILAMPTNNTPTSNTTITPPVTTTASTVNIGSNQTLGQYLTDAAGKTLYYFKSDTKGVSTCTGSCAAIWPAFYASQITVASPLVQSDFATIARSDGTSQTTYKGQPLYYYSQDVNPGDTNGQGISNLWYVVAP